LKIDSTLKQNFGLGVVMKKVDFDVL